jgi:hypothetical protein
MANTTKNSIKSKVLLQDLDEHFKAQLLGVPPKEASLYADSYRSDKALILLSTGELKPPKCKTCYSRGYRLMATPTKGPYKDEDFKKVACHCITKQVDPPDMERLQKRAKFEQDEKDRANSRGVIENPPSPTGDGERTTKIQLKRRQTKAAIEPNHGREEKDIPSNETVPKSRKKRDPAKSKAKIPNDTEKPGCSK